MALKGDLNKTYTNNSAFTALLNWTATQRIPENDSTVTASLRIRSNFSWAVGSNWNGVTATININGSSGSQAINHAVSGGGTTGVLFSREVRVPHNADGTKSFPISFSISFGDVSWNGSKIGSTSASGTGTLNRIARVSSFSINKTTADFGTSITLTITKSDASFQHRIVAMFAGDSKVVTEKTTASTVNWTLPNEWIGRIPNGVSSPMAFYVETYSGNALIGASEGKSITATVPASIKPSISSITGIEKDGKILSLALGAGKYVQGKSIIRVTIAVNIAYAATITSYKITLRSGTKIINTWSHNGHTFDIYFDNFNYLYGEPIIDYEAIDSRGRSAKASLTINLLPYTRPQIISFEANRVGNGTELAIKKVVSATRIDTNKSHYEVKVWSRPVGGYYEIQHQQSNGNTENITLSGFDVATSYEIILQVIDFFGEDQRAESGINVTTLAVILDWHKDTGLGIGKMHEDLGSIMDVKGRINTNRTGLYQSGFQYEDLPNGNAYVADYWKSFLVYGHSWFFYNPQRSTTANMLSGPQVISCWTDGGTIFIQSQSITDGKLAFMRISGTTVVQPWKAPY